MKRLRAIVMCWGVVDPREKDHVLSRLKADWEFLEGCIAEVQGVLTILTAYEHTGTDECRG